VWFKFPKGVERISVERQQFVAEATDAAGVGYFRAPDHFAPMILTINGFTIASEVPEGAPADLPRADPLRDTAIAKLTVEAEAMKIEVQNLRTDLGAARAKVVALELEKTELGMRLQEAQARIARMEEDQEEASEVSTLKVVAGKGK